MWAKYTDSVGCEMAKYLHFFKKEDIITPPTTEIKDFEWVPGTLMANRALRALGGIRRLSFAMQRI